MRAAVVTAAGTVPVAMGFPEPEPFAGREVLDLVGAGVHRVVRAIAAGSHYSSGDRYPLVAGVDAVARASDGRLVYTGRAAAPWGTIAERIATPLSVELPTGADPLAVAAGVNPAMSGWMPLSARIAESGLLGTVVVLGATGMAGRMAVREAFVLGAERVVAVGRDAEALRTLDGLGAVTVSLLPDPDAAVAPLAAALRDADHVTVLDYVWGAPAAAAFAALERRGADDDDADIAYIQIGSLAGLEASVPASLLRSRSIRISGSGAGSTSTKRIVAEMPRIIALISDGTLVAPYTAYPLARVAEAWHHDGQTRAVVVPD